MMLKNKGHYAIYLNAKTWLLFAPPLSKFLATRLRAAERAASGAATNLPPAQRQKREWCLRPDPEQAEMGLTDHS